MTTLNAILKDITKMEVDVIVNAANTSLLGGGGVDGAIHRVAGPELLKECQTLNGCETGFAKITKGYNTPAKYIIHTVGPVWRGGNHNEKELLSSCYRQTLDIAINHDARSIAFPCISTGIYRFPIDLAAKIAIDQVKSWIQENKVNNTLENVTFCCFSLIDLDVYKKLLDE